jgi:hypothetical protein
MAGCGPQAIAHRDGRGFDVLGGGYGAGGTDLGGFPVYAGKCEHGSGTDSDG